MDLYVLDGKRPVRESDLFRWADWMATVNAQAGTVGLTQVGDGTVSTHFLGLSAGGQEHPLLFETRGVGLGAEVQERYATWDEAEAGHAAAVAELRARYAAAVRELPADVGGAEFQEAFSRDALARARRPVILDLDFTTVLTLIAQLQLALRHPANVGAAGRLTRETVARLIDHVAVTPALRRGLEAGFDADQDTPVVPAPAASTVPPATRRVESLCAFLATEDGEEDVCATHHPSLGSLPLIGADQARVEAFRPVAQQIARQSGLTVTLVRFRTREDLEVIRP